MITTHRNPHDVRSAESIYQRYLMAEAAEQAAHRHWLACKAESERLAKLWGEEAYRGPQ